MRKEREIEAPPLEVRLEQVENWRQTKMKMQKETLEQKTNSESSKHRQERTQCKPGEAIRHQLEREET